MRCEQKFLVKMQTHRGNSYFWKGISLKIWPCSIGYAAMAFAGLNYSNSTARMCSLVSLHLDWHSIWLLERQGMLQSTYYSTWHPIRWVDKLAHFFFPFFIKRLIMLIHSLLGEISMKLLHHCCHNTSLFQRKAEKQMSWYLNHFPLEDFIFSG